MLLVVPGVGLSGWFAVALFGRFMFVWRKGKVVRKEACSKDRDVSYIANIKCYSRAGGFDDYSRRWSR